MKPFMKLLIPGLAVLGIFLSCNNDGTDSSRVSSVSMSSDSLSLAVGETRTVTATVYPTTADDRSVTWSSSDETIVVMDSCYATAVAVGTATVTVTTTDGGYTGTCDIYVSAFPENYTSIDTDGPANCYVISKSGIYCFDATVMGNGETTDGIDAPTTLSPSSAEILWQTDTAVVANAWYSDGLMAVKVTDYGNAVVAAKNSAGEILWSWHIWFPEDEIYSITSTRGYEVMNMNLGSVHEGSYPISDAADLGLLYQWGRKDPFPSGGELDSDDAIIYDTDSNYVYISSISGGSIADAIANPSSILLDTGSGDWLSTSNDYLWGNPEGNEADEDGYYCVNLGEKTIYDPCPAGWQVACADVFNGIGTEFGTVTDYELFNVVDMAGDGVVDADDFTYGWFANMGGSPNFLPAAGRYDGSTGVLGSVGTLATYWSNAPASDSTTGSAFCALDADVSYISIDTDLGRANACSVRCVKEE